MMEMPDFGGKMFSGYCDDFASGKWPCDCGCFMLPRPWPTNAVPFMPPPPPPRPRSDQLPDMRALQMPPTTPFVRILFNREYALLMEELYSLREDLIGAKALIALVKNGKPLNELTGAFTRTNERTGEMFIRVAQYVRDAAYGDAGARYRGFLPKVPEVPVVPFCKALKSRSMDWSDFMLYLQSECEEGCLKGNVNWVDSRGTLRTTAVRALLDALNMAFINLVGDHGFCLFAEDDFVRSVGQENLDIALALIKQPPASVRSSSTVMPLPPAILEELYTQGKLVRAALANKGRLIGNSFFHKLTAASGQAAQDLSEDVLVEYSLARTDLEQVATVCANTAAMHLKLKQYQSAIAVADEGIIASEKWKAEPTSYAARHAFTVRQLRTGKLANSPKAARRQFTEAQKEADKTILRKLYLRKGRAQAALCLEQMRAQQALMSPLVRTTTKKLYASAKQSFESCYKLDSTDPTPFREVMEFSRAYEAELERETLANLDLD